jgi:lipopolysaccharide export system protein LptA
MLEKNMHRMFSFLMVCLLSNLAIALPDDIKEMMHINAAASQFNYKTGESIYEGNVKIDQGTTHITADRVITHNNKQHKIEEAIAYGLTQPAVYITIPKMNDELLKATADIIKFYPAQSKVIFENNVIVHQGENSFNGPVIIYNINDQLVSAPPSIGGRATIMIKPA